MRVSGVAGSKVRIERLLRALKQIRGGPSHCTLAPLIRGGRVEPFLPLPFAEEDGEIPP